jgi:hypothetical protein
MQVFFVRTEPVATARREATAFVVAHNVDARRVLGDIAGHEKGGYGFRVLGQSAHPAAPPAAT